MLVVDDSAIMRRNLSAILEREGHIIVAEAADGEAAFNEYRKHKPDLVTMDITMPVLDGVGAVKKIINFDPEAQIIMISAMDQKYMVLRALQNGARHYVIKPFSSEKVLEVINEVLNRIPAPQRSKPPDSSPGINRTITDISRSINNINAAIRTLDREISEDK